MQFGVGKRWVFFEEGGLIEEDTSELGFSEGASGEFFGEELVNDGAEGPKVSFE